MPSIRSLPAALALAVALPFAGAHAADTAAQTANAVPDSVRAAIAHTVAQINDTAAITSITPMPIGRLNEVLAQGTVLYVSDDGRYLFHGTLLDVEQRKNLTEIAQAATRRDLLASIPASEKIIYAPKGEVKHTITVFTDISCGYCKALHNNLQGYLDHGIQVEYVAWPRGGTASPAYADMERIWCAADRQAAYTAAVAGETITGPRDCTNNPVRSHYALGDQLGVEGTPAVYTRDGMQHGGFLLPDDLIARLGAQ